MDKVFNTMGTDTYLIDFAADPRFGETEINTTFTVTKTQTDGINDTLDPSADIVYNVLV